MTKQLLLLSLVVILCGCSNTESINQNKYNKQTQTELSTEDYESSLGSSSSKELYPDEQGMSGYLDYSDMALYVKEHLNESDKEEILYDFENNPLASIDLENQIDYSFKIMNNIVIDDVISEYTDIDTKCDIYTAKLSKNKNKLYMKYNNSDKKGIITITHNDSTIVYKIEDSEIIALSLGDGIYTVKMYVTKQGVTCTYKGKFDIVAENSDKNTTYKGQSYYSNYSTDDTEFIETAQSLWDRSNSNSNYIWNCYIYTSKYPYDYDKCNDIDNGKLLRYRPDVETLIDEQKGICLDKAAVMASLLRAKDIPAKVVFGYYKNLYHAWVEVNFNNEWLLFDPTLKVDYSCSEIKNYSVSRYN